MNKKRGKLKFTFVYVDFEYVITQKGMKKDEPGGWYNEGIAQLAAIVESEGWDVSLIHLTDPVSKEEFLKLLRVHRPDVLGFSVRTGVRVYNKKLIGWADHATDATILVGSYHPTLWPDKVIKWPGVNAICLGEGEKALKQFLNNYSEGKSISKIGSLWVKDGNGKIHKNPVQPLVVDLDELPLPKFDIFDFSRLIASQNKVPIVVLTRGCAYNCTYCWNNYVRNLYPNKQCYVRYRSPKNCIKYCKGVMKVYPETKSFRFLDDLWPFYNDWFENFSKLYDKKINLPFECNLRANLLNEKIIKRLKEIQCFGIYFGVESGNEYIRNKILKRNMTEQTLVDAFLTCKKYGIRTHSFNIVGIPHENMKTVLDTVKLNAKLEPTDMFTPIFFPYAGTELHDIAIKEGFWDPKAKMHPYVNIQMPDFTRDQIRFASLYAKLYIRLYQFVFKAHDIFRKPFEKVLDFLWLFPYWPFKFLNWLMYNYRKFENWLKAFIKKNFFWLYLQLRGY
ncbi:B12-binding domain-containing radical SAM protein [Patescibacteria group bacterium]